MLEISQVEKDFYLEIKSSADDTLERVRKLLTKQSVNLENHPYKKFYDLLNNSDFSDEQVEAILKLLKWELYGIAHSLFCSIDGATALSSEGRALGLINLKTDKALTEGALHENFFDVALDNE